jgi:pimeloyl-ACP methyl ester carboxylesterase
MPDRDPVVEANLAAARADLATAEVEGDVERIALLEALIGAEGSLVIYHPERRHFGVLLGDLAGAPHVAVMVPGVGDERNLCEEWLPSARNLYEEAGSAAVILWKAYDNPPDLLAAATTALACSQHLRESAARLADYVRSLALADGQTLTVVAHSFGSTVTGAALADFELRCTDVVVAGSPGMSVDDLRQLHLEESHFFTEEAPGDEVARLGVFGARPTSPEFGGVRLRTNAPGHPEVRAHSNYFVPGSEALANIVDVVTGRHAELTAHHATVGEVAGGLVAWSLRLPVAPLAAAGRHYRGPGFRVLVNVRRLVEATATGVGDLVRDGLDGGERAVARLAHRPVAE